MDREPNLDPYKRLFETMLDGAVVLDVTTGRIALANKAAARIFGFPSPEEMVGLNPLDYVPQEDQERIAQMIVETLERDPAAPYEVRIFTRDKRIVWVSASATHIEYEGRKATFTTIRDITSERDKDAALRDAERRYENLFDGMMDGAVVLDISTFKIAYANKAAAEMFGFSSPREVVGENPLSYIPEDDRDEVARQIALNLQGEGKNPAEIRVITRDKRNLWVSATASTIDYEGRTATLTTLRDITADKAKDAALKAAEEGKLQLIDAAAESIFVVQDWKMVYVNPAGAAVAGLSQKDMIGLSFQDFVHPDQRAALTERYERLLAGQWFSDFTTVKGIDAKGETRWAEIREIPYSWQGRPAVMSLVHDITDRMRVDEERKEREERFRSIIENAWDGITILDENYNVVFESPSLARISGYTPEEWMGRPVGQMNIHPDDLAPLLVKIETLKSQPGSVITDVKIRYQHKDGSWRWIEATGRNLLHDPKVKGLVVNFRDITERKRTEDEGKRLSTAIEQAADIVVVTDREGVIQYVNPAFTKITGYTSDEAIGQNPRVLKSGRHDQAFYRDLWDTITAGKTWTGHFVNKKKDGSLYDEEATISPIRNSSGEITNFVAVKHDVTERMRTAEALENSEQRFRALIENATDAVAIVGPNGEILYESPAARRISGYTTEEMVGHYVTEYIAPEDLGKVADLFVDLKDHHGKTVPPLQVRFKHGDGSWHTAEMTIQNLVHVPGIGGAVINYRDITARLKMEEALKHSEERFRTLIEKATDVVIVLDATGKITYQSPSLERVTGFGHDEWLGRPLDQLLIHPDDMLSLATLLERVLNQPGATFEGVTARYQHKDGSWHTLEATVTNMLHDPKIAGIVANFRDITDRKAAQQALTESEQKYRLLVENSTDVIFSLDTQGNFTYVSPAIERISGYRVDEVVGTSFVRFVMPEDLPALMASFERTLAGATEPSEFKAVLKDGTIRHVQTTSKVVMQDGKVVGLTGVMSDVTERKKAQEALSASETKYRNLFEHTLIGMEVVDGETGKVMLSNHFIASMFGFKSPQDIVGTNPMDYVLPEDLEWVANRFAQMLATSEIQEPTTLRARTQDGRIIWVHGTTTSFEYEGRPSALISLIDMTATKEAEDKLRASEERNRLLIDNAAEVVTVVQDGLIKFINRKCTELAGYSPEELISKSFIELIHPDDRQMVADNYVKRLSGGEAPTTYDMRVIHKDGRTRWASTSVTMFTWEGKLATLGLLTDITDRKQAEAEILALSNAFRATLDPVLILDMQGNVRNTNEAAKRLFETDELGIGALKYVVPEDEERVASAMQDLIASGRATVDRFSIVTRSGRRVPIEASASLMLDANGKPVGIVVVERDVTERRKAEQALRESEEKFRLITEKTNDLVWMTDINLVTIYVSPSAERLLGFRPEELIKLSPESLMTPESFGRAQEILLKQLDLERDPMADPQRTVTLELEYYRKDGSTVWLENRISGIRDANGVLTGMHGVGRDISERKMAEGALKESEERFRTLIEKSTDAIAILDSSGNLLYESPSMERITGYKLEDWIGKPVGDWLLHPDDLATMASLLEKVLGQPDAISEEVSVRFKHKDGTWHFLEGTVRNLLGDPKVKGLVINYRDVTERKKAQEALLASEADYRNLFHQTLLGMEVVDGQTGKVMLANHAIATMFGFNSPEEMVGLDAITGWVLPEDMEWVIREFARVMAEPAKRDVATLRVRGKDGRIVWVSASGTFFDYEGKPAILISLIDVTAAKEAEDKLRDSEEKNRLLIDNSIEAISVIQDGAIKFANRRFAESVGFSAQELVSRSFADFIHPDDRQRVAEYYFKRMSGEEAPSSYQFRWIDREEADHWGEASVAILNWEGRPATLCMLSDITERVEAEQAVRESESRFRALVQNVQDIILIMDIDGKVVFENPATAATIGESLLGKIGFDVIHPEDVSNAKRAFNDVVNRVNDDSPLHIRMRRVDASWLDMEVLGANLLDDISVRGMLVVCRDVTLRLKAQRELRDSEERFRALIEEATDAVAILEPSGKTVYYSPSMRRVTGYTPEEWAGKSLGDLLIHPDDLVSLASLLEEMKQPNATAEGITVRYVHKDGLWHTLEATVRNMIHDPKIGGIVANFRDVTERVKAEQALKESEERFRGLVETTSDWVWEIDRHSRYTYVSPKVRDILGHEPRELLGHTPFEFMHQREGRRVSKIVRRFADAHLPFSLLENTCIHKDGHSVALETSAVPILDSDGGFLGYRGIDRDITERKKVEQELQRSLKRLEKTMESTIEAITTTIETRDPYTTGHQMRVTDLACAIAKVMEVPPTQIEGIRVAGLLHDIGKIAIPTEILSKPGKLTEVEFSMIKTHAKTGYNILKKIEFAWPVAKAVLQHHERWNGSGYPHGIRGEDILLEARILAVADVMEAMASHRPYRPSVGLDKALEEVSKNSGILYDPAVAKACETAFARDGFKFVSAVPGVVAESGSTSSDRPVHSPEDR